jgi:Icc-related predicted phosphoesterase
VTRILAFTDPHGELRSAAAILDLARRERPDLILCPGDFTYFGTRYDGFLTRLKELAQDVLYVNGNHEDASTPEKIQVWYPFMRNVEDKIVESSTVRVAGLPATGEYWPGERFDEDALNSALALLSTKGSKPLILLSHYPPTRTAVSGTTYLTPDSGGSALVRKIVETLRPALFLCGHYHQDFGKEDKLGPTRLVNPGPDGKILEV